MVQLAQPAIRSATFPAICPLPAIQLYCALGIDFCPKLFGK